MRRPSLQVGIAALLVLVALAAVNLWLFRLGVLPGLIGLNASKHVLIALLCRRLGVDKGARPLGAAADHARRSSLVR